MFNWTGLYFIVQECQLFSKVLVGQFGSFWKFTTDQPLYLKVEIISSRILSSKSKI